MMLRRPTTSSTGSEKSTVCAWECAPAPSIMARMMASFCSCRVTIRIISFSAAIESPRNFSAYSSPKPLACTTVPPPAPALRAMSMTVSA